MMMRQIALGLLILFAAPTIAWGDPADDAEAMAKCMTLLARGTQCVEWYWFSGGRVEKGEDCPSTQSSSVTAVTSDCPELGKKCAASVNKRPKTTTTANICPCNRHAYQDFGVGERIKYQWCKARY